MFKAFATLTQFSAKITTRHNVYLKKKSEKANNPKNILCIDSFVEAVKNCDFSFARHLNTKKLFDNHFLNNFKISYVSNESFFENKHGFSEKDLKNGVPTIVIRDKKVLHVPFGFYQKLVSGILHSNHYTFNIQFRGFKTERSVKAEIQRNPSLTTRVKHAFGLQSPESIESKLGNTTTTNAGKLKQMLITDDTLNENEKQRIKIAFAEGYLLGNNSNSRSGKSSKYFKLVTQILTIFIFLAIVVSLMASASGSVFR